MINNMGIIYDEKITLHAIDKLKLYAREWINKINTFLLDFIAEKVRLQHRPQATCAKMREEQAEEC